MPGHIFDSHAHYDDKRFDPDRDALLGSLFAEGGVSGIVNIGCDIPSSLASVALAEKYPAVYASAGIHPHEAKDAPADYLEQIEKMLQNKKVVAIGEIGLDFHYDFSPREIQREIFYEQLALADRTGYPVIIHDREAHAECVEAALSFPNVRGVFHSFSGSPETARILVKAGWYISISGVVTFKNASKLPAVAAEVPEDRLLAETDAPYLSPHPNRGKRNDSANIRYILEKIAELRGITPEEAALMTERNARELFRLG